MDLMSPPKSASQYRDKFNCSGGSRMHIIGEYSWVFCKYPMSLATLLSSLADHTVMCFANRVTANVTSGLLMRQSHINFIINLAECGESCPLISSSAGIRAPSSHEGEDRPSPAFSLALHTVQRTVLRSQMILRPLLCSLETTQAYGFVLRLFHILTVDLNLYTA